MAENSGLIKHIELRPYSVHHEPTLQIVRPDHTSRDTCHSKVASEALDYVKCCKPEDGKTLILVLAMTAGEFYGSNSNDDAWNERDVKDGPVVLSSSEGLKNTYKTFEQFAKIFKHHVNKDPTTNIGDVRKAFYNDGMHRVELLLALDNSRAEDIVSKVNNGDFPAVSMGCKQPYDVCNVCGNRAANLRQYCDHMKFQRGAIMPNGRHVFVWNPNSKFYDISIVGRPAGKITYAMKKVAEVSLHDRDQGAYAPLSATLGEHIQDLCVKRAMVAKLSILHKRLVGVPAVTKDEDGDMSITKRFFDEVAVPAEKQSEQLPEDVITQLASFAPREVTHTMQYASMPCTAPEMFRYFMKRLGFKAPMPAHVTENLAGILPSILDALHAAPDILSEIQDSGVLGDAPQEPNQKILRIICIQLPNRSVTADALASKTAGYFANTLRRKWDAVTGKPEDHGMWDVVEVQHPETGEQYNTTRYAIERAEDAATGKALNAGWRGALGAGALLSGVSMLDRAGLTGKLLAPGLAVGGLYSMSTAKLPPVSMNISDDMALTPDTELVDKKSSLDVFSHTMRIACETNWYPKAVARMSKYAHLVRAENFDELAHKIGAILLSAQRF